MADKNIKLSKELIEKLQRKIKETDFNSIQDYIIYVLNQLVVSEENQEEASKDESVNYSPGEEYGSIEERYKKYLEESKKMCWKIDSFEEWSRRVENDSLGENEIIK